MTEAFSPRQLGDAPLTRVVNVTLVSTLLFASVVLNIFLAQKVSRLKASIEVVKLEGQLQVGNTLPLMQGRSVNGAEQVLNYGEVHIPTVLYVFTPQCTWCAKNLDNLRVLISDSGSRFRVIGISLTRKDLKGYLEKEGLSFPVYTDIGEQIISTYRLGSTPETIVVSPEAKVLKVWSGVYVDGTRQEIESYLKVHLPGCCTETAAKTSDSGF